jgi:phosphatidylserine/phosphatidylglycerophosphate/cardiolipin synthase-like enzyme
MNRFDPPGFLDDLTDAQKDQWSQIISNWLDRARAGRPNSNDGPRGQFFNPLTAPPADDKQVAIIAWNAFPRQIKSTSLSDRQRWRRADSDRNLQDEYCEWSVTRDQITSKITRVTFTCEGPEYWEVLATLNPDKVLGLYKEFVSPAIKREDLFTNGEYNPFNRFNNSTTRGAMHLIQPANSLSAEIELGAAATIRRVRNGTELTGAQELILCSRYGEPGRNSDPFIGEQVNALARQKADITINNPVGLYLHEFNPVGWTTPDSADPREFWKFVRGKDGHFVRAVFEVPLDRGYVVGDIKSDGRKIEFGAQIADFITIKLEGMATRFGQSTVDPFQECRVAVQPPAAPAPPSIVTALPELPLRSRSDADAAGVVAAPPDLLAAGGEAEIEDEAEKELIARLPEELRRDFELVEADDSAAPPALRPYPRLPQEEFKTRLVSGKIMAYASPDSTYAVTKKLLDSAQRSIVIGIYDFHADYMKETLKKAMMRGVKVSLMLDTNSADDPTLFNELTILGANCVKAPSSSAGNSIAYFGNAHEKIIVVDGEIVMIQSGNWSRNSIPLNEEDGVAVGGFVKGNRDMGIALQSKELATFFAELVARDMRLAQGLPPNQAPPNAPAATALPPNIFFEAAPPEVPVRLFSSLTVTPSTPVRVTPVVTPENFHDTAKEFLRSAKRSIRIEQQYIRGGQAAIEALLSEIDAAREENPDLDIRIIVSPKYLAGDNKRRFVKAMEDFDLEFDDNYRYLSSKHFVHCHNKLIVVDNEKVLLGSQNWSTTGVMSNREASLLVEHAGIAAYFAEIFDADWNMSEPTEAPPDALFAAAVEGLAKPADFAEGGIVSSTIRDYTDV